MSSSTLQSPPRATLSDLSKVSSKAELIGGEVVHFMPTGYRPGKIGARLHTELDEYAESSRIGAAAPDSVGFTIAELPSGRESFSPYAAYFTMPKPTNQMRFAVGAPDFAVEVRSENDYGPSAELEMAAKRDDYFQAGTLVVWDVDPEGMTIKSYRFDAPDQPQIFKLGDEANAEPAVPGWSISVDWVMRPT